MGAFFIARKDAFSERSERLDQAHRARGFALARRFDLGSHALYLYRKLDGNGGLVVETEDGGTACLTGQLLYRGQAGAEGLRLLCHDLKRGKVDGRRLIGQFALLLQDSGGLRVFTDPLGFYQVYVNETEGVAASSFWSLLELLPRLTVDSAGVYEYAWNGATFGGKTFLREIRRLPARSEIVVADRMDLSPHGHWPQNAAQEDAAAAKFDDYVELHTARLRAFFGDLAEAFGDKLRVSFSSGYDSRLILAGLKAAGLRPRLFVYGQDGDTDVEIARRVAGGEGLRLDVVNKRALVDPERAASKARQEDDFVRFDAWKVDGVFDDGVDVPDRLSRHQDGGVPLNGSLGEIYRNFFYVPDRPMSLTAVVESFFSGYAPAACSSRFAAKDYNRHLAEAFQTELGSSDRVISRAQVESLYPLVRGRYWTGRDVTLNLRFGRMFFPFMQPQLIAGTAEIPIAFKDHGRLEARIIARLDPALAAYPSGYGYRFTDPPPFKHRAKAWLTLYRPPWLRRYSYRLRFSRPQPFPPFLTTEHLAQFIDSSLPYMRGYFHPERLHDPAAFNRIATMEYIFQRYNAGEAS